MNDGIFWTKEVGNLNESMSYDHNGNILALQRNQRKHELVADTAYYGSKTIDNLSYTYHDISGDRLASVEDAAADTAGFNNGASASTEYTYDVNGNLTADQNKGISNISYNILGKPELINFADGRKIEYVYDASGTKLKMKTYAVGQTLPGLTTDYVGQFVYENNNLAFFGSTEGRVVKNGSNLEYQYSIEDHQGNSRVVFTSAPQTPVALKATFEEDANDESNQYSNVANIVSFLSANHTPGGIKVVRMNQGYSVGPAKSLKVFPGDSVRMEVGTYYESASGYGTENISLAAMITHVASVFTAGMSPGAETQAIQSGVNDALTAFGMGGNRGDEQPAAYLNYIQFDQDYNVLNAGWEVVPASANFSKQKISIPTKSIKEAGFMYVYLSYENESNNHVYFDDFKVTHVKTNVVQYNEYYPFGLSASTSWTREGSKNDFLYNGSNELNSNTGWYEMFFRGYDPALGRMLQVDPYATNYASHTPYNCGMNNPIGFNDPSGGQVDATGLSDSQLRALHHANMWRAYTSLSGQYGDYSTYKLWVSGNVTGFSLDSWHENGVIFAEGRRPIRDNSRFWNEVLALLSLDENFHITNMGDGTFASEYSYSVSGGFFGRDEVKYIDGVAGLFVADISISTGPVGAQQGDVQQAGLGWDLSLAFLSTASYAAGVYENARAGQIAKHGMAYLKEWQSIRNFNKSYRMARQATLASAIIKNVNMIDGIKLGAKRMIGVGTVLGLLDVANSRPEERMGKLGWVAADAVMAGVGLTGWGVPIAGAYFLGRFAYGIYEMANKD